MSQGLLYLALSISIAIILKSHLLFSLLLIVEILQHIDHLVNIVPLKFRGHRQVVLKHVSRLGLLRVHLEGSCSLLRCRISLRQLLRLIAKSRRIDWRTLCCLRYNHNRPR